MKKNVADKLRPHDEQHTCPFKFKFRYVVKINSILRINVESVVINRV